MACNQEHKNMLKKKKHVLYIEKQDLEIKV